MKKIIVASKNPVKINAVKTGFDKVFPKLTFEIAGLSVSSDVSDQPMSDEETLKGAINRAKNAEEKYKDAEYWVGIEGGIEKKGADMMAFAWVVILSNDTIGKARTGAFFLPPRVVELINQGKELGEADDIVFGHTNSKQQGGAVGLLTENVIDRTGLYVDAVVLALIPFKNKDIY